MAVRQQAQDKGKTYKATGGTITVYDDRYDMKIPLTRERKGFETLTEIRFEERKYNYVVYLQSRYFARPHTLCFPQKALAAELYMLLTERRAQALQRDAKKAREVYEALAGDVALAEKWNNTAAERAWQETKAWCAKTAERKHRDDRRSTAMVLFVFLMLVVAFGRFVVLR